jgi:hypothetical protein
MQNNGNTTINTTGDDMKTKDYAEEWLEQHNCSVNSKSIRVSKYYPGKNIWFLTLPASFFDFGKKGELNILLQNENTKEQFHYLKVPFSFFMKNKQKFDVRASGEQFDLHISAKVHNWMVCERSDGINFREFACS